MEPATRKQRLLAIVVDSVVISGASLIAAYEGFPDSIRFAGLAAGAAILVANLYFLTVAGQTIGKRVVGIRIVRRDGEENGGFVVNVLRRGVLPGLPYIALTMAHPILGGLYIWTDILFIFRADRRCVHDHIAGTLVVQSKGE